MRHPRPDLTHLATTAALLLLLVPAAPLGAQETPKPEAPVRSSGAQEAPRSVIPTPPAEPPVNRIYQVKNADVEDLSSVIRIFSVGITANHDLRVIGLHGQPADVRAALEALERLDVPPAPSRNIALTLYVLLGSKESDGDGLPADLAPVSRQLAGSLGYRSLDLLDTILVRTRNRGRVATSGTFSSFPGMAANELPLRATYDFEAHSTELLTRDGTNVVRLNGLYFKFDPRRTKESTLRQTTLETDVEVPEGQKVVVGKATADPIDRGLILVLEAKVE